MKLKRILGIETSCDETGAAVLEQTKDGIQILSNVVASSASLQAKYGGIIPEQAAREQIKTIIPVIKEALQQAQYTSDDVEAIAVTQGPGLIGSLLVGVETAKTLSWIWNKPLIPVNHLIGHFYANWIVHPGGESQVHPHNVHPRGENQVKPSDHLRGEPEFPCLGLLVSGGHTDIVLFTSHNQYTYLGGTRDDAAGECFDKCARLLDLPYPGGPQISKLATQGNPKAFKLPRPMLDSDDLDLSFSGLKTAVANLVNTPEVKARLKQTHTSGVKPDLCASIEAAIIDCLVKKITKAAQTHKVEHLIVAGGVAANPKLAEELKKALPQIKIHIPSPSLCTDNAAMIASAAFFNTQTTTYSKLQADPNLSLAY